MKTFFLVSIFLLFAASVNAAAFPTGAFKCEKVRDDGTRILISTGTIEAVAVGSQSLPLLTLEYENTNEVSARGTKILGIASIQQHENQPTRIVVSIRGPPRGVIVSADGKIVADASYGSTVCTQ